jgi:hypothetical protein
LLPSNLPPPPHTPTPPFSPLSAYEPPRPTSRLLNPSSQYFAVAPYLSYILNHLFLRPHHVRIALLCPPKGSVCMYVHITSLCTDADIHSVSSVPVSGWFESRALPTASVPPQDPISLIEHETQRLVCMYVHLPSLCTDADTHSVSSVPVSGWFESRALPTAFVPPPLTGGFIFFPTHHLFYCHPTPPTPLNPPFAFALDCLQVVRLLCQTIEVSSETFLDQSPTGRLLRGRRTTLTERPWLFLSLSKPRGHSFV